LELDDKLTKAVLDKLTEIGILFRKRGIRCSECSFMFDSYEDGDDLEDEQFCHGCDKAVEIDETDIEIFY